MIKIRNLYLVCFVLLSYGMQAQTSQFEFSKAGFFELGNSGRQIYNFNSGWRFFKGKVENGQFADIKDSDWEIVNCPHGLELNSDQASGGANYQGEAWYRKHFSIPFDSKNRRITLHFESVMGKCKLWLNGELLMEHFGGYLPFEVDLTGLLKDGENLLAVLADNGNDPDYPPGKPQEQMDFSYFGGIYRDVWLVSTAKTYITNPNAVSEVAGGGVFVYYEELSKSSVKVVVKTHIQNSDAAKSLMLQTVLKDQLGKIVAQSTSKISIEAAKVKSIEQTLSVKNPAMWSPDCPTLYSLEIALLNTKKEKIDGVRLKQGIRKIEFRGRDGFYLNNEPYEGKLTGTNRHQDQGYVGNAVPNNMTLRDAVLLKKAGVKIIRAAHYPADPSFMDACDALGMFFIVATPGWQFWNDKPIFEERVLSDIRNMVRRDRNHTSVIWWEPILNETWYPADFAEKACKTVHEEYPYPGAYTASDNSARGGEYSDLTYSHQFEGDWWPKAVEPTGENYQKYAFDYSKDSRTFFVREWGDTPENWSAQNSPSRAARNWGEQPQLIQAKHYEHMDMVNTDWETIYKLPKQHIGGTLWCGFDHQRGYSEHPFYGGLTDVFRQPKYSYYLFESQKDPGLYGPMLYIAHEMSPFSSPDITVFTNCEEVRLIRYEKDTFNIRVRDLNRALPHPSVVFKDIFRFYDVKGLYGTKGMEQAATIVAEGLIDGKVVIRDKRTTAQAVRKIALEVLEPDVPFEANGSDFVAVIASVTDENGNTRRYYNGHIRFEVEGEGEIIDNGKIFANPRILEWGTAPVLIRATNTPGKIVVKAYIAEEGINKAAPATLELETSTSSSPAIYSEERKYQKIFVNIDSKADTDINDLERKVNELERELNQLKLKEVEKQQTDFIEGVK